MSNRLDPNDLPGELRKAVKEALRLGWTAKRGGAGGWKLRSPGGTQWMHVAPASNIPDIVARDLRTKIGKAAMQEADDDLLAALGDPKETSVTIVCTVCGMEFLATDGFLAHQTACSQAAYAAQQAEQEASKAITPPAVDDPSDGRTEPLPGYVKSSRLPAPSHRPDFPETPDSSKMSTKEEDAVVENKRGPYRNRKIVQPGLARALYEAMRSRTQRRDEALSIYANTLAEMMTDAGFEYQEVILSDAERKIAKVFEALDIDVDMLTKGASLREENEQLRSDLTTLKELLGKY